MQHPITYPITYTDQIGRQLTLKHMPSRIISLVPSLTELLCDLELEDAIVGVTKYCVHPTHLRKHKTIIGGTKTLHLSKVQSLRPDLVIANKEENTKESIDAIAKYCPVYVSEIKSPADSYQAITALGHILHRPTQASQRVSQLQALLTQPQFSGQKVGYLIWKDPYLTAGGDTYISNMLSSIGLSNAFGHLDRYPQVSVDDLISAELDYLMLSSEPYPFKQKHLDELSDLIPHTQICLVDGEVFSWYGTRLLKVKDYFTQLHISLTRD